MSETVIKIENLYKEYRLGVIGHGTLYRDLQSWWATARGKEDPNSLLGHTDNGKGLDRILALNDINLEVMDGEVLGIIGANGTGKSTLLKILSRVTAPTKGLVKVKGRIASLLEVGTGFHPELTGRENIYLNGAINGMDKKEVSAKLDEIVDFAGVERFLDTPVKRYSSGMHVRLGFAVAAHLEPEILVVDEVLAVGDASFQKKAIGKMEDVSKGEGRTVLFVSHNMESVKSLCTRTVLLKEGKIINNGPTEDVINSYLASTSDDAVKYSGERTWNLDNAPGNNEVRLMAIRTKNAEGQVRSEFDVTEDILIEVDYKVLTAGTQVAGGLQFTNSSGVWLCFAPDDYFRGPWGKQKPKALGLHRAIFTVPGNLLDDDTIIVAVGMFQPPMQPTNNNHFFDVHGAIAFQVIDSFKQDGARGSYPFTWGSPAVRPHIKCVTTHFNPIQ